jgi:hypothetical protein
MGFLDRHKYPKKFLQLKFLGDLELVLNAKN